MVRAGRADPGQSSRLSDGEQESSGGPRLEARAMSK
jgi:hypothetical protein